MRVLQPGDIVVCVASYPVGLYCDDSVPSECIGQLYPGDLALVLSVCDKPDDVVDILTRSGIVAPVWIHYIEPKETP